MKLPVIKLSQGKMQKSMPVFSCGDSIKNINIIFFGNIIILQ
jgi:hypothetical protein